MESKISNEKYIEVAPGIRLHVTDQGNGRPVILLPGLPLSNEMFKYTFDALVEKGYRAIGITLRGFGKSDASEDYDIDLHADDVHKVIEELQLQDAVFGGYSFGGVIAAYYIAKYNPAAVSKLLLISSNTPKYTKSDDYPYGPAVEDFNMVVGMVETHFEDIVNVYGPIFHLDEQSMPLATGNWINNINLQATKSAMKQGAVLLRDFDLRPLLGKIEIPTFIFHGTADETVPYEIAEQAHQGIKNSQLVTFENSGHWYIFTEQEKFITELLKVIG